MGKTKKEPERIEDLLIFNGSGSQAQALDNSLCSRYGTDRTTAGN